MNVVNELFNLFFFSVTKYKYDGNHICDFREIPRPRYCMSAIFEGHGEFVFDTKSIVVQEGDIIFIPVGATYISKWFGSPNVVYISAHFSFAYNNLISNRKDFPIQKVRLENTTEVKKIYLEMYNNRNKPFSVLSNFYKILNDIYYNLECAETPHIDSRIEKAIEYIKYHSKERLSIDNLSGLCNMSNSRFFSLFKESTGYSPIDYKNRICVRNAELLLIDEKHKSIDEISELAGFNSPEYFRYIFKKITKKTPTEYRNCNTKTKFGN